MPVRLHEAAHAPSGLEVLRGRIRAAHVPAARSDNLRLATWNIRELGKHPRMEESIKLIAAIIATFDLVAVVELRDDLGDMRRILRSLGPNWSIVFSDYLADPGGNRERVGFAFNRERVTFTGLASTADGPRRRVADGYVSSIPWWRPPFMASFQARELEFVLLAAHVRWGGTANQRRTEVEALADWVMGRTTEQFFAGKSVFVVGDFNLQLHAGASLGGLVVPSALADTVKTDLAQHKRYDQILCLPRDASRFTGRAGALDFYCGDYRPLLPQTKITKERFTLELSDHLPLWAEA